MPSASPTGIVQSLLPSRAFPGLTGRRRAILASCVLAPLGAGILSSLAFVHVLARHAQARLQHIVVAEEDLRMRYEPAPDSDLAFPIQADPFAECTLPGWPVVDSASSASSPRHWLLGYAVGGSTMVRLHRVGCKVEAQASLGWSMTPGWSMHEGLVDIALTDYDIHPVDALQGVQTASTKVDAKAVMLGAERMAQQRSRGGAAAPQARPGTPSRDGGGRESAADQEASLAYGRMLVRQARERALAAPAHRQPATTPPMRDQMLAARGYVIQGGDQSPATLAYGRVIAQAARERALAARAGPTPGAGQVP